MVRWAGSPAWPPAGLLGPQGQQRGDGLGGGGPGMGFGPAGAIRQRLDSLLAAATQPLVGGLAADAKTSAQLADIAPGQPGQSEEIFALGPGMTRLPAPAGKCHPGSPPPVTYVPGPYTESRSQTACLWAAGGL